MLGRKRTTLASGAVLVLAASLGPGVFPSHGQSPDVSCRSCLIPGGPCALSYGASGRVTEAVTGFPVAGAVVVVQGLDPVFADSDGHFTALSTRPDVCTLDYAFQLSVAAGGYRTFTQGGYFSAVAFPMHIDVVLEPHPVTVVLGSAVGFPGGSAELSATIDTDGEEVARVEHEIGINRGAPIAANGGDPACRLGPGLGDASSLFVFLPRGCQPTSDCERLRVVVNAPAAITDGSLLYECTLEISQEPADTCVHSVPCERVGARDMVGATVNAACTDGQVVSDVSVGRHLDVEYLVEPPRPVVGDDVVLQVAVRGPGGLPQYRLSGTDPFLDGDTSPLTDGSFGEVEYELRAVRAGTAELRMSVNYEVQMGCPGRYFFAFVTDVSDPFLLEIGGGVAPDCTGDCDGDNRVLVDEVVTCVNMGLGMLAADTCGACDADRNGVVGIGEIVQAVNIGIGRLACVADPLF